MTDVLIHDMVGFSKIAIGTPSALCRELHGGGFDYGTNPIVRLGTSGQRMVRKGMSRVATSCVCTGVAKADWSLWIPEAIDLQIAGMFDTLAEVDDGSNGAEFVLSGGQPSKLGLQWTDAEDALVEFTLDALWALATPQAVGTDIPVYYDDTADMVYGPGDIGVELDSTPYGVISINLQVDLKTVMQNTATVRLATAKTMPDGYVLTGVEPTVELITEEPIVIGQLTDDEYTAGDFAITLDNGYAAQDAVIAVIDMVCPNFNLPWEGEGKIGFAHNFILGSSADVWGSVTVT